MKKYQLVEQLFKVIAGKWTFLGIADSVKSLFLKRDC